MTSPKTYPAAFLSRLFAPDFPFRPRRFPFFYGWAVMFVATLGIVFSIPGQTIGISAFTDHLIEAYGLTRVQLSAAYMIGTITSAFLLPRGGRLFDRIGARAMAVISTLALGATLVYLSQGDRLARQIAPSVVTAWIVIYLGIFLVRFSGQGLLTMVSRAMLGKWFNRRRGLAFGISGVVAAFGFAIAPLVFDTLIERTDWRQTWLLLAAAVGVGMTLLAWLTFRDNPEECGLTMDGDPTPPQEGEDESEADSRWRIRHEFTLAEARRNYAFWVFNLGMGANALILTAATFHISSIAAWRGIDREAAFALFVPISIVSTVATLLTGWLSDRIRCKWLLMGMMGSLALGMAGFPMLETPWGYAMTAVGLGASGGMFGCLSGVVWPRFYGRLHLGAISGLNMATMVFCSALGPWLLSLSYDWRDSYAFGLYAMMAMPLALLIGAWWAENPQTRLAKAGETPPL